MQAFDFLEFDATNIRLTKVTDSKRLAEYYKQIAPFYHVTADDAPTLLLHGDADRLVPTVGADCGKIQGSWGCS